ncbi:MAG: DHA2 family efflux MFS transporter permease subunit [Alphaproteobacteria bacterium]|nr:MAG: DHA2 family efflux MFS transporter permease subunit [Alphaproteobacteria bacterium]
MASLPRIIPLVVASALFMENTDATVIATSLPAMAADLGQDPVILKLAFTTYLLALTVFIPVSGWCADRFGARNVFRAAIAVFTLGSIACGLSTSLEGLIAARFLQGVGGAMMVPVGRLIILRTVAKSEIVGALAMLTIPALMGPLLGPPIGGFITTYFHWRWIFWINVPVGILGMVLATLHMPDIREEGMPPLDALGFLLSGLGLSALVFGATVFGRDVLPAHGAPVLIAIGLVLTSLYVLHASRSANPILDLDLLKVATFRSGVMGGSLFRIGVGAIPFLLPLMLQLGFKLTPFQSGSLTCAAALGALTMKFTAARILKRFGFRSVLLFNAVVSAATLAVQGLFTPQTPHLLILALLLAGGFFRSLQFTSLNALSYSDIPAREMGSATSLYTVAQQLSLAVGVVCAASVLEFAQYLRGDLVLSVTDFAYAFFAVAFISALSVFSHLKLAPDAGSEVSGRGVAKVGEGA